MEKCVPPHHKQQQHKKLNEQLSEWNTQKTFSATTAATTIKTTRTLLRSEQWVVNFPPSLFRLTPRRGIIFLSSSFVKKIFFSKWRRNRSRLGKYIIMQMMGKMTTRAFHVRDPWMCLCRVQWVLDGASEALAGIKIPTLAKANSFESLCRFSFILAANSPISSPLCIFISVILFFFCSANQHHHNHESRKYPSSQSPPPLYLCPTYYYHSEQE